MASIKKRGNSYRITVSNGRDLSGKQLLETATFVPDPARTEKQNQKALEKFVYEFEEKVKSGKFLDGEKITFQAFAERWLKEYAAAQLELTTIDVYKLLLKSHILPAIGHLKLAKIQPVHLNNLYNAMLARRQDGREGGYSPTTIKRVHALISSILSTAVRWNVLFENPCERVRPPKQTHNTEDIKYFTIEQTAAFLGALDHDLKHGNITLQHVLFFHLALFCGLRRGELVALTWADVDPEKGLLNIDKSTGLVSGKPYTKAPKNKSSVRVISVPGSVLELIKTYRKEQLKYRLTLGSAWEGDNFIFTQWNGCQMYPSTPYSVFKGIIHRYNDRTEDSSQKLPDIPLHGLRHTSATLLISQNIDVRTVSGRLGHAQTSTTMNIYSHALKKMDEKAADTLDSLFQPKYIEALTKC